MSHKSYALPLRVFTLVSHNKRGAIFAKINRHDAIRAKTRFPQVLDQVLRHSGRLFPGHRRVHRDHVRQHLPSQCLVIGPDRNIGLSHCQ